MRSVPEDITIDLKGQPRLSQAELARLAAAGVTVSDSETTGLNRRRNGFTEFGSIKSVRQEDGSYRLIAFNPFILPLKPEYQDYLAEKKRAAAEGRPAPIYDPVRYEYAIEPKALAVTGTRFLRDGPGGPILGMELKQKDGSYKKLDAKPFYEVADDLVDFLNPRDLYFNAPFDLPFLAEQLRDVYTHRILSAWREGDASVAKRYGLSGAWLAAQPADELAAAVHDELMLPEKLSLENPADGRCLMHGYLYAQGPGPSNRLDDAYRALVDPNFTGRDEHSALEDIVMAAKVGLALEPMIGYPTMAELYAKVLQKADPGLRVEVNHQKPKREGEPALGDITLVFSHPADKLTGRARDYWNFFADFHEARERNSRTPPHVRDILPMEGRIVLSADRKQPMILSLLRKTMFYERLLDTGLFTSLSPYDSIGNRIDVTLKDGTVIEDTHYGSLRANLKTLAQHPETLAENLAFIRDVREADRKVGTVLLRPGEDGTGGSIVLKGHQRSMGDVTFHVPVGHRFIDAQPKLLEQIDFLLKLGLLPDAEGLRANIPEEDGDENDPASPEAAKQATKEPEAEDWLKQDIFFHDDQFRLTLSPSLYQAIARRVGVGADASMLGSLSVTQGDGKVKIDGNAADFKRAILNPDGNDKTASAFRAIRDVSWLLYRLKSIPGTTDVTLEGAMVKLDQSPYLSRESLEVLHRAGVPFKAYPDCIKIDFDQLLHDGFYWSKRIGEVMQDMRKNADKPPHLYQAPPVYYGEIQHALLDHVIQAVESNEQGQFWVLEASRNLKGEAPHHRLYFNDDHLRLEGAAGKPDLLRSTIDGPHRVQEELLVPGETLLKMSAVMSQLVKGDMQRRQPDIKLRETDEGLLVANEKREALSPSIASASRIIYRLSRLNGMARPLANDIDAEGNEWTLSPPRMDVINSSLQSDLARLATALTSTSLDQQTQTMIEALPQTAGADRRRDHAGLVIGKLGMALPKMESLIAVLGATQRTISDINLDDRLRKELGQFSTLIHELAAAQETGRLGEQGDLLFQRTLQARQVIAQLAYGMERFEQSLTALEKAIGPIHQLLGDALIEDSDRFLLSCPDAASLEMGLEQLNARVRPLIEEAMRHRAAQEGEDRSANHLRQAYENKAFHYLLTLEKGDPGNRPAILNDSRSIAPSGRYVSH